MSDQAILITVVAVLAAMSLVAWAVWAESKRRRARALHERFGPEYAQARQEYGRQAEQELEKRVRRVNRLHLRPLRAEARDEFAVAWRSTQARFVDDPRLAVAEADRLITDVMEARGYPMADFERRAADISVEHPRVVSDYRTAHAIAERSGRGDTTTEDLREAMVHYKAMFQDLLSVGSRELEEVRS